MWLEAPVSLRTGEELLVSFTPPGEFVKLHALCEVRRVGRSSRASDPTGVGVGVVFTDLSDSDRKRLAASLLGRPPPLPWRVRWRARGTSRHRHVYATIAVPLSRPSLPALLDQRIEECCDAPWTSLSPLMTGGVPQAECGRLPGPRDEDDEGR
jgi:hypothetical protein